ncbi:MAG: hypothetical protein ACPL1Z_02205 [Candidatus Bathyarchaeales archaeon]|nr:MAG: hypothetical protein C0199_00260 [Candidatus Bathyarchaeota archaeon]
MSTQTPPKRLTFRWTTLKGITALILFLITAALIEYVIVVYAVALGVREENPLQWKIQFPGTNWTATISVSPLFHLVSISTMMALVFSWICLTRYMAVKTPKAFREKPKLPPRRKREKFTTKMVDAVRNFFGKIKSRMLKVKGIAYLWNKMSAARVTIKSAIILLLVFSTLILLASVLAYPRLIYQTFSNLYQGNPSLLEFVKSTNNALKDFAEAVAPVGWICSAINNALISAAPGFRDFVLTLGRVTKPLADLPPTGKFLAFQNLAAWISALTVLFYGAYMRKGYRYRKPKRS